MKILFLMAFFVACTSEPKIGLLNKELRPCPDKPNCVSSYASESDKEHFVSALEASKPEECLLKLSKDLAAQTDVDLLESKADYAHLVYTSSLMRFKDDLELYAPSKSKGLQIRSASRTGYSDMGVNRKRVEKIRLISNSLCK